MKRLILITIIAYSVSLISCTTDENTNLGNGNNDINNENVPNNEIVMDFSFDEHAFVIHKGEKLRIDISSSAHPYYVRHTNNKGLFSEQITAKIADNTVILNKSYIEIPIA